MKIHTIGFTEKKAERFFDLIKKSGTSKIIDVRLSNQSQLAGFAKKDDLRFFLKEICGVEYVHMPDLAPTKENLSKYKKKEMVWDEYADRFLDLMSQRRIEKYLKLGDLEGGCLLCSEHLPHNCHRTLVIDYLNKNWPDQKLEPKHLK